MSWLVIFTIVVVISATIVLGILLNAWLDMQGEDEENQLNIEGATLVLVDQSYDQYVLDAEILSCNRNLGRILRGANYIDLKQDRDDCTLVELICYNVRPDDCAKIRSWAFDIATWGMGSANLRVPRSKDFFDTYHLTDVYPTSVKIEPSIEFTDAGINRGDLSARITLCVTWMPPTNKTLEATPNRNRVLVPAH